MKDVEKCVVQQSRYWRCMRPQEAGNIEKIRAFYISSEIHLMNAEFGEKKGEYRLHGKIFVLQKCGRSTDGTVKTSFGPINRKCCLKNTR